tara:strand:- start:4 stop:462 length:459 start_codon:yes stop_codon:yes gene_type:complete
VKFVNIIVFFLLLFSQTIKAKDFKYKVIGTLTEDHVIMFPKGGKFVSFHHLGGFETELGKYGEYECRGNILYDETSKLENMYFACEHKDQQNETFITTGKRLRGSDVDRAVGKMSIVEGEGFWQNYVDYTCTYAIEYVNKTIFSPVHCKKSP